MRDEGTNVYTFDEKGDKVLLDAAGRQAAIAQNEKLMRDIGCTPMAGPTAPSTTY
jgi:hypothetical protein